MNFISRIIMAIWIITCMSQCVVVRNFHNDKVDIGLLKDKGEGHISASFDTNDETSGVNAGFIYSPAEHLLIGAGISSFSYKYLHREKNANDPNYDVDQDKGQLKGYKVRANIGYYTNFGRDKTSCLESIITGTYGKNDLKLGAQLSDIGYQIFTYNPISVSAQVGLGKNMKSIGFIGGIKFDYYNFQQEIPIIHDSYAASLSDYVSIIELYMAVRAGKGPLKANLQISVSNNLTSAFYDSEPIPAISAGVSFVFGRKRITEMSL